MTEFQLRPPSTQQPGTVVRVASGLRRDLDTQLARVFDARRGIAIADATVLELWGGELGCTPALGTVQVPSGEAAKTPEVLLRVARELVNRGLTRDGYVVALGGGATGDLAGLCACLHMRGVPVVQVPTTLLAMVDAGLGGKCAVNLPEGKNLFGAFWAPALMLVDPDFTCTLPDAQRLSGIGEIAKYAVGFSTELFERLETEACNDVAAVVASCLRIKARVVDADPFEAPGGDRILLNLGHTTAHALEAWSHARGATVAHGAAVGFGLRIAARQSLPPHDIERVDRLLDRLGLPARLGDLMTTVPEIDDLLPYLARDKKTAGGDLRCVVPAGIGSCETRVLEPRRLAEVIVSLA